MLCGFLGLISFLYILLDFYPKNKHYFLTNKNIIWIEYTSYISSEDINDDDIIRVLSFENVEKVIIKPSLDKQAAKRSFYFFGKYSKYYHSEKGKWREGGISSNRLKQKYLQKSQAPIEFKGINDWKFLIEIFKQDLRDKIN